MNDLCQPWWICRRPNRHRTRFKFSSDDGVCPLMRVQPISAQFSKVKSVQHSVTSAIAHRKALLCKSSRALSVVNENVVCVKPFSAPLLTWVRMHPSACDMRVRAAVCVLRFILFGPLLIENFARVQIQIPGARWRFVAVERNSKAQLWNSNRERESERQRKVTRSFSLGEVGFVCNNYFSESLFLVGL